MCCPTSPTKSKNERMQSGWQKTCRPTKSLICGNSRGSKKYATQLNHECAETVGAAKKYAIRLNHECGETVGANVIFSLDESLMNHRQKSNYPCKKLTLSNKQQYFLPQDRPKRKICNLVGVPKKYASRLNH